MNTAITHIQTDAATAGVMLDDMPAPDDGDYDDDYFDDCDIDYQYGLYYRCHYCSEPWCSDCYPLL